MSQIKLSQLHNNPVIQSQLKPITLTLQQLSPVFTKPINATNGGTGYNTYNAGDFLVGGTSGNISKLPIGTSDQILTIKSGQLQWTDDIINLKNTISGNDLVNHYSTVNTTLNGLKTTFTDKGIEVSELTQKSTYLTGQINILSKQVNTNQTTLSAANTRVTTLSNTKDSLNTSINTITSTVASMANTITTIDSDLDTALSSITTLQGDIASTNNAINAAEENINNNSLFKNLIINGNFLVWQRATYFSGVNTTNYLTADHWSHSTGHGGTLTSQQSSATLSTGEITNSVRLTLVGNAGGFSFQTTIEDVRTLQGQTATLSFWAKGTAITGFAVNVYQYTGATISVFSHSYSTSTTWTKIEASFLVPSLVNVNITNIGYILVSFDFAAGTDFSGVEFARVQLEQGGAATPFVRRPYHLETLLCKRYYESGYVSFTGQGTASLGVATSFAYAVDKYKTPTLSFQLVSSSGFRTSPAPSVGFLNQPNTGSVRVTKDGTTSYGMYIVKYLSESEIL